MSLFASLGNGAFGQGSHPFAPTPSSGAAGAQQQPPPASASSSSHALNSLFDAFADPAVIIGGAGGGGRDETRSSFFQSLPPPHQQHQHHSLMPPSSASALTTSQSTPSLAPSHAHGLGSSSLLPLPGRRATPQSSSASSTAQGAPLSHPAFDHVRTGAVSSYQAAHFQEAPPTATATAASDRPNTTPPFAHLLATSTLAKVRAFDYINLVELLPAIRLQRRMAGDASAAPYTLPSQPNSADDPSIPDEVLTPREWELALAYLARLATALGADPAHIDALLSLNSQLISSPVREWSHRAVARWHARQRREWVLSGRRAFALDRPSVEHLQELLWEERDRAAEWQAYRDQEEGLPASLSSQALVADDSGRTHRAGAANAVPASSSYPPSHEARDGHPTTHHHHDLGYSSLTRPSTSASEHASGRLAPSISIASSLVKATGLVAAGGGSHSASQPISPELAVRSPPGPPPASAVSALAPSFAADVLGPEEKGRKPSGGRNGDASGDRGGSAGEKSGSGGGGRAGRKGNTSSNSNAANSAGGGGGGNPSVEDLPFPCFVCGSTRAHDHRACTSSTLFNGAPAQTHRVGAEQKVVFRDSGKTACLDFNMAVGCQRRSTHPEREHRCTICGDGRHGLGSCPILRKGGGGGGGQHGEGGESPASVSAPASRQAGGGGGGSGGGGGDRRRRGERGGGGGGRGATSTTT